jgi:hypothetical protein
MFQNEWIAQSDSLFTQVFLLVMGGLYASAFISGFTYKAMNIYFYFALFLRSPKKYYVLAATLLFFVFPKVEYLCSFFFDACVAFINYQVHYFHSTYVNVCIYWCVLLPLALYVPFIIKRFDTKTLQKIALGLVVFCVLYMVVIYPNFKPMLLHYSKLYLTK